MITKEPTETAEPQLARFNEGGDPTKCILDTVQGGYRAKVHGKTQAYTMERPWAKLDEFGTKKLAPKRAVTLPVPYDCGEDQRLVYKGTTNLRLKQRLGNIIKTRAKSAPLHGSPQPSGQSTVEGPKCSAAKSRYRALCKESAAPQRSKSAVGEHEVSFMMGEDGFIKNKKLWQSPLQRKKDYKDVITRQIRTQAPAAAEVGKFGGGGIVMNPCGATMGGAAGAPRKLARKARQDLDQRDCRKIQDIYTNVQKAFQARRFSKLPKQFLKDPNSIVA